MDDNKHNFGNTGNCDAAELQEQATERAPAGNGGRIKDRENIENEALKFDVFLTRLCDNEGSLEKLDSFFTREELEEYYKSDKCCEVVIAEGVSATELRHLKKILEKNDVPFAIKAHDDSERSLLKQNFLPKNIALLETLKGYESYKPSTADGFYFIVLILAAFLLLLNIAYVFFKSETELHRAVQRQDIDRVRSLLENQPYRIDLRDKYNRIPLHYVQGKDSAKSLYIAKMLLDNGSDLNTKDVYGKIPVDYINDDDSVNSRALIFLLSPGKLVNKKYGYRSAGKTTAAVKKYLMAGQEPYL